MIRQRARELGFIIVGLPSGPLNAITDVPGVLVGHRTLHDDACQPPVHTGVTTILPHGGDLFHHKAIAAVHTINGYGKAAGFEQVRELGTLETPIALTNTLCVGRAWDGLVTWILARHPEIGTSGPSVNPVVGECNDSQLNDLRGRHVTADHVLEALEAARSGLVEEGSVGAGAGMVCYGFKGGIGTASRVVGQYVLGALLVANFGRREQLLIRGRPVGRLLVRSGGTVESQSAAGSVVMIIATDAPLSDRQLGRVARRAGAGLARTGSTIGGQSGDFVLAFSTAQWIPQDVPVGQLEIRCLHESALDPFFDAVVETVEEAVINALCAALPVNGPNGRLVPTLPVEEVARILEA